MDSYVKNYLVEKLMASSTEGLKLSGRWFSLIKSHSVESSRDHLVHVQLR